MVVDIAFDNRHVNTIVVLEKCIKNVHNLRYTIYVGDIAWLNFWVTVSLVYHSVRICQIICGIIFVCSVETMKMLTMMM